LWSARDGGEDACVSEIGVCGRAVVVVEWVVVGWVVVEWVVESGDFASACTQSSVVDKHSIVCIAPTPQSRLGFVLSPAIGVVFGLHPHTCG